MKRVTIAVVAGLLVAATAAGQAGAEQADRDRARVHFERGVALYEAGSYQDALDEFQAAYEAQPHPAVLVNIANSYARTNRPVRALQAFERYLRERGARVDATERAEIERVMEEQRRLVGELRVVVTGIEGELRIDGLPVGSTPGEHRELVRAGSHSVEVRPGTGAPIVRQVSVQGRGSAEVRIAPEPVFEPAIPPAGAGEPPAGAGEPPEPRLGDEPGGASASGPARREAAPGAVLAITGTRGARVFLDGSRVGRIPLEQPVEPGEHDLRLEGPGLVTYETVLDLAPGERTEVAVDLTRGERPRWVPALEWGLLGLAGAMIVPGVAMAGVGWGRFQDSEAMFGEIDAGRFSSAAEEDLMWFRYNEMYDEYFGLWQGGWAMIGVGLAAAVASVVLFGLDRGMGLFSGRPRAEIDMMPIEDDDAEDDD